MQEGRDQLDSARVPHTHTHTHICTHTHTHAHGTDRHTHTHIHTYTDTQTHTHTLWLPVPNREDRASIRRGGTTGAIYPSAKPASSAATRAGGIAFLLAPLYLPILRFYCHCALTTLKHHHHHHHHTTLHRELSSNGPTKISLQRRADSLTPTITTPPSFSFACHEQ